MAISKPPIMSTCDVVGVVTAVASAPYLNGAKITMSTNGAESRKNSQIDVVATTSIWLFFLLSAPFVLIVILAPFKYGALATAVTTPTASHVDIIGGLLIAMWNYMGWDNASTIAA